MLEFSANDWFESSLMNPEHSLSACDIIDCCVVSSEYTLGGATIKNYAYIPFTKLT